MRRLLLAILIAASVVLLQLVPAQAGGSTSVLVTNQPVGRATALVHTDIRYFELEQFLTNTTPVATRADFPRGEALTVTWLAHDTHVWRTHQVWLDAAGGPLVATKAVDDRGDLPAMPAWARVNQTPELKALLTDLGMIGKVKPSATMADGAEPIAPPAPAPAAEVEVEAARDPASPWFTLTGWRWVVPGLLAGLLLGVAAVPAQRLARGTRARRPSRRLHVAEDTVAGERPVVQHRFMNDRSFTRADSPGGSRP